MTTHNAQVVPVEAAAGIYRWDAKCSCGWRAKHTTGNRVAAHKYMDRHIEKRVTKACSSPGKRAFQTRAEAMRSLGTIWRRGRGGKLPARAYMCRCGKWHLTSQAKVNANV